MNERATGGPAALSHSASPREAGPRPMAIRRQNGFTLIELMIVLFIMGVLAAIMITVYQDITNGARVATEDGVIGALSSAMVVYFGKSGAFPDQATLVTLVNPAVPALSSLAGTPNLGHTVSYNVTSGCLSVTTTAANHPDSHIHSTC